MAYESALFDRNNLQKYNTLFLFIGVIVAKNIDYFKFGKLMCKKHAGEQVKASFSVLKCGRISKSFSV